MTTSGVLRRTALVVAVAASLPACMTVGNQVAVRERERPAVNARIEQVMVDGVLQFAVCEVCPDVTPKVKESEAHSASATDPQALPPYERNRFQRIAAEIEKTVADLVAKAKNEVEQADRAPADAPVPAETPVAPTPLSVHKPQPVAPREVMMVSATTEVKHEAVVTFPFDRRDLTPAAREVIDGLLPVARTAVRIVVKGFTDALGSKPYNDHLARTRAEAVKQELVAKGVTTEIEVAAEGSCCYVASNASAEGRARNRRAEIAIVERQPVRSAKVAALGR